MSIRALGRSKWQVDYYPVGRKGKRVQITFYGTKDEAQLFEQEVRKASRNVALEIKSNKLISEIFPSYLEWYKLHRAETTYRDISSIYSNHLKKYFNPILAEQVSLQHINFYKQMRKKEKGSNRTINKELNYFSGFLRWCEREGYITQRQFRIDKLPYKRPVPMVLSFEEIVRLIESTSPFYKAFFLCLYSLGLRLKEARMLKTEDFDMENYIVKVKQKGGTYKILPLNKWLVSALLPLMPRRGFIFLSKRTGRPIVDVRKALTRAKNKIGISKSVYPHLLRHSFATHLLGRNVNLRVIQQFLGHKQINTTEFYTQVAIENLRDATRLFDFKINTFTTPKLNNIKDL